MNKYRFYLPLLGFLLLACKKQGQPESFGPHMNFPLGGSCTVYDQSSLAFGFRIPGLTAQEGTAFFVGNSLFRQNWVIAPSSTSARDGLGPLFNAKSCSGCHQEDGRGQPYEGLGMLYRLGSPTGNGVTLDNVYTNQLQDHGIAGISAEGTMQVTYQEIVGVYPDGTTYSLRKPTHAITGTAYGSVSSSHISPRIGQQMIGLGLLELIPEWRLQQLADPWDADGDGISGRINYVVDLATNTLEAGRFGWKANQPNLKQQVAGAFNGDIGITSLLFPEENYTQTEFTAFGSPVFSGGDPEISDSDLDAVVLYCRTLAVPAQRNAYSAQVRRGNQLFTTLECAKCHTPNHTSSTDGSIAALKNVSFYPFTDLLLHDMGPELADGLPDGQAGGSEWRTQPLWGLGLIRTVNNHTFLLHDGRARTIEEAILWHGGEAEVSKQAFKNLTASDRMAVIKFLESL